MNQKPKALLADESGAMAVVVAVLLVGLLCLAALAVDYGRMAWVQYELKKASEAGALAGASALGATANPDWAQGQAKAQLIVKQNQVDGRFLTDSQAQPGYWNLITHTLKPSGIIPTVNDHPAIQVTIKKDSADNGGPLQLIFGPFFGINESDLEAVSVAIIRPSSSSNPFDYTIFSGSPSDALNLNGSQIIDGSIHANDNVRINGSSIISQVVEGVTGVRINGSADIGAVMAGDASDIFFNGACTIHDLPPRDGAVNIAMPDYAEQIASTATQSFGGDKTFNGSVNVDGSIYVNGKVVLNGSVDSTGAILAADDITVNGSASITGTNQVCLYSANGDILINGSSSMGCDASAVIYAPHGKVTINGSCNYHGRIVANEVRINGSGNFNGDSFPVKTLPLKSHGAALVK